MEWAVDATSAQAVSALRREVMSYLGRHAAPDADLAGAEIVVAELLTNAFKHAAGPAWVCATWTGESPCLEVHDLGAGFDLRAELPPASAAGGRGLFLAGAFAGDLRRADKAAGGSKVSATLPIKRRTEASYDPPRRSIGALPAPPEARADGTFGKEAFLRALVVELAQAVEAIQGPSAAEAVVAQVGADVGGRMEEAHRAARNVAGRLSPKEMADLFVRLKRAIGGDFYVIEADEEKIVLGNRRCPFGHAVQQEPALCRLTSSVFGGIAARNSGSSAVALEERIALGDPECRVVVWLGQAAQLRPPGAHLYAGPADVADAVDEDLVEACRAAMHGEPFLYPTAVAAFMRDFLRRGESVDRAPIEPLTARELEIVRLIADSHTGREIATLLSISEKTVERHRQNILLKLGLRDRVALTRYAIRRGLVEA